MTNRLANLTNQFKQFYGHEPEAVVNSPGRAEILGNHTDYNFGYALSGAISRSTLGLFAKRADKKIIIRSTLYGSGNQAVEFSLEKIGRDEKIKWGNYAKAVIRELVKQGKKMGGAEILVDSNFSTAGGLSSSAALELCLAYGLMTLQKEPIEPGKTAWLCKAAENSDLVQSPCGFLDQGTIAFAQKDRLVFLDFLPPVKVKLITSDFHKHQLSFVAVIDRKVKRILGESGYPARREMCEAAGKILKVKSLREVSVTEFENKKERLEPVMRKRVEHVVKENQRVLDAVKALKSEDMVRFGQLLTESGQSALNLYDLDEKTPELRFLMEQAQIQPGVLGARNMGGGFSAIILALVKDRFMQEFKLKLNRFYRNKYKRELEAIEFDLSQGVAVV